MFLSERDLIELTEWRHQLHRRPELSGEEAETARKVEAALAATGADRILTGLGGHGVAAMYDGRMPGPTQSCFPLCVHQSEKVGPRYEKTVSEADVKTGAIQDHSYYLDRESQSTP